MLIRDFHDSDWPQVWPIVREVCARGDTFVYPRDIDEAFARQIWVMAPPHRTVVAVDGDGVTVLGTAKAGPNQMGPGAHIATASFMVSPSARRRGVGRALGEAAVAWARDAGFHGMQFNAVVDANTAAVALWTSLGFETVGVVPEAFRHPEHGLVGLRVMFRRL